MASGYKDGPPPNHLYVIKNSYEIRYYTTPETFAQAIADGYREDSELAVYRRCETPEGATISEILAANPQPTLNTKGFATPLQMMMCSQASPARDAAYERYRKDIKARRKRVKALLLTVLERY